MAGDFNGHSEKHDDQHGGYGFGLIKKEGKGLLSFVQL